MTSLILCHYDDVIVVNTMNDYAHSTISNINADSPKLWVHTLTSVTFLVIALVFMRRFSAKLDIENEEDAARALMVSYIPKDQCFKNTVTQHFKYVVHLASTHQLHCYV